MTDRLSVLVVAKAPVPGQAKTWLAPAIGFAAALALVQMPAPVAS